METIETDLVYCCMRKDLSGVIDVFVDGSYSALDCNGESESQPFGAGWAIAGKDGTLSGYGVSSTWAEQTLSSDLSELRAMLSFLDTIHSHFSHLVDRKNVFRIHSDSQNLIGLLQRNLMQDELPRETAKRYGSDYDRIVEHRMNLTVSFHWVKGHAENEFNGLADVLARKSYRQMVAKGSFNGEERRQYIREILLSRNINTTVIPQIKAVETDTTSPEVLHESPSSESVVREERKTVWVWDDYKHLLVSFKSHKTKYRTFFISSVEAEGLYDHIIGIESLSVSREALQIKAIVQALARYRAEEGFNPSEPVILWSNAHAGAAMMNSIVKGKEPVFDPNDIMLKNNIEVLKDLVGGMDVRYLDDLDGRLHHLSAVSNIIFENHIEKVSKSKTV